MKTKTYLDEILPLIKRADFHCHLGTAVAPSTLWDIAAAMGINTNAKTYSEFVNTFNITNSIAHSDYLRMYELVHPVQSSPLAMKMCVEEAIKYAYVVHNLEHIELRFNPMKRNRGSEYDLDSIIVNACFGLQLAMIKYPITASIIIETDRNFTQEQSLIIAEKAVKYKHLGISAIDVSGGNPDTQPLSAHTPAYELAYKNGLAITAHLSEVDSVEEVRHGIENWKTNRIGHGVQVPLTKNKELLEMLSKNNVSLELCPTSNIRTGITKPEDWRNIILNMIEYNAPFTINTDGWLFLNTSNEQELRFILSLFSEKEIADFNLVNILNENIEKAKFLK